MRRVEHFLSFRCRAEPMRLEQASNINRRLGVMRPTCGVARSILLAMGIFGSIAVALPLSILASPQRSNPPKEAQYQRELRHAADLATQRAYPEALAEFRKIATTTDSTDVMADAILQAGRILARQCHNEDAVGEFLKVIKMSPGRLPWKSPVVRNASRELFSTLLRMERYDQAIEFARADIEGSSLSKAGREAEIRRKESIAARWKSGAPTRKQIRQAIEEFAHATASGDGGGLSKTLSPRFSQEKLSRIQKQLKAHPIEQMEIVTLEISITEAGNHAKADVVMQIKELGGVVGVRTFFFALSQTKGLWLIDSF